MINLHGSVTNRYAFLFYFFYDPRLDVSRLLRRQLSKTVP